MCSAKLESLSYQDIFIRGIKLVKYIPGIWVTCKDQVNLLPFESRYEYRFSKPRNIKQYQDVMLVTDTYEMILDPIDKIDYPEFKVIDRVVYHLKDGAVIVCNGKRNNPKFVLIKKGLPNE